MKDFAWLLGLTSGFGISGYMVLKGVTSDTLGLITLILTLVLIGLVLLGEFE